MSQRAALYCRVSTADQSCERQERDLTAYAQRHGFEVVGIYKETASGARNDRVVRQHVIDLARTGTIETVLVTELSRWGRSTIDLVQSLQGLQERGVAVIASTGMRFDLSTPHGRMLATMLACVAEFERDLLRERVRSGLAAANARGVKLGRPFGTRVKSDPLTPDVLARLDQGLSYRTIARELGLSKNTVLDIVARHRLRSSGPQFSSAAGQL